MLNLVDSHCHLDFEPLNADLDPVLERARAAGVAHMLCVSVALETFPDIRDLAHRHSQIFASVGVHPNEREGREPEVTELAALAADPRVVAVGETGLDYYRSRGDMRWQQERFRRHIRAARQVGKPLIIHTRAAAPDTLKLMEEEGAREVGGVMHCFTETADVARAALDLNFHISFSGIITFANAAALREIAAWLPADRLLVETDAPYLAPEPHRGKTNEPAFVRHVAERIAELRGVSASALAADTTRNFFRLFSAAQPAGPVSA